MADTPRAPYLGRYLVVLLLVTLLCKVAQWAAFTFLSTLLPDGGLAIVPPMVAALHVGQTWGRERGTLPEGAVAWRWAAVAGLVFLAVQALVWPLVLASINVTEQVLVWVALIVAGTTIMAVILNRVFLTIGAKAAIARPRG